MLKKHDKQSVSAPTLYCLSFFDTMQEVSEMTISNASFDIDGIAYLIIDANGSDAKSMFAMAEMILKDADL